jgi:hypothetical protein
MADLDVPEWISAHVRKCPTGETARRTIVSKGTMGIKFTMFAILREIIRPSDCKGRHRPAEARFAVQYAYRSFDNATDFSNLILLFYRLDIWPSGKSETGDLETRRATDWAFQSYEAGSLGQDILPFVEAITCHY